MSLTHRVYITGEMAGSQLQPTNATVNLRIERIGDIKKMRFLEMVGGG